MGGCSGCGCHWVAGKWLADTAACVRARARVHIKTLLETNRVRHGGEQHAAANLRPQARGRVWVRVSYPRGLPAPVTLPNRPTALYTDCAIDAYCAHSLVPNVHDLQTASDRNPGRTPFDKKGLTREKYMLRSIIEALVRTHLRRSRSFSL